MSGMKALPSRREIPEKYRWRLEDLYQSPAAWETDLKRVDDLLQRVPGYQGRIGEKPAVLLEVLKLEEQISRLTEKIFVYARMKRDEDNTDSESQARADRAQALAARVGTVTSFILPELMALPEETLLSYPEQEPELAIYRHYFADLLRKKKHILSPEEERIMALGSEVTQAGEDVFSMLNHADLKFPRISNEEGEEVELTHGRYLRFIESRDRRVRREAFTALHQTYRKYRNTLTATLNAGVKRNVFYTRARHYNSALEAALDGDNIPVAVYDNLLTTVRESLPILHRYLEVKRSLLGLDELHLYDLYTPLISDYEAKIGFEEAKSLILRGLEPLGPDYQKLLKRSFAEHWIDVYENQGKTSGAYSWGAYDGHPYLLLNYQDTGNDLFTLGHELGHAMHSAYSNQEQPYVYAQYPIFLAEIASTVNEVLMVFYMMETAADEKSKLYYFNYFLEHFRATVFRQAMFAEFEKLLHEQVEKGEALTPGWLEEEYVKLVHAYHGPEVIVDEEIAAEWSRIPHFYYNFYVYKYATGFCAAVALVQSFREEGEAAIKRYFSFLQSGGSDYPLAILQQAGIDLSKPQPIKEAMLTFERLVEEFAALSGGATG